MDHNVNARKDDGPEAVPVSSSPAHSVGAGVLERIILTAEPVLRWIAGVGIAVLMLATALDVGSRIITGRSVPGVIEVTEVVLVISVYFALLTAGRDGQHIRVRLLTDRLVPPVRRVVRSLGLAISILIVGWLTWATASKAIDSVISGEYRIGLAHVPIWPARVAIPLGLLLLALLLLFLLVVQITKYSSAVGREIEAFEDLMEDPITKDAS